MYHHILIPTDGSPLSDEAVRHGVELAADTGAKILFLTVTEPFHTFSLGIDQVEDTRGSYGAHMLERAARILQGAGAVATASGVPYETTHSEDDQPYRAIIRTAEESGCDLIAMASHGRRGVSALVLGSETVKVLTHSTIPVLVYRTAGGTPHRKVEDHRKGIQLATAG
jgi:nucleotide-binding universal stress UspA family protein